jgi:GT2 family glycosyltransferase
MLQSPADIVGGLSGEGHGRYACFALCLVRTYVFEKIGFLDERFQLGYEDTEFSFRALKAGFKIDVVDTGSVHLGRRSSFGLQPLARKTKSAFLFWHGIERKPFSEMLLLLAFEPLMLFLISVLGKDFAYSKFLPLAKRFVRSPWEA